MTSRIYKILSVVGIVIMASGILGMLANYLNVLHNINLNGIDYINYRDVDSTYTNVLITQGLIDTNDNLVKTKETMDGNNLSIILNTAVLLAGIFLNPLLLKVLRKVTVFDKNNITDHNDIKRELKNYKTKNDIIIGLRDIIGHSLEAAPAELTKFINFEGEQVISFAQELMNSRFDYTVLPQIDVKLDTCMENAQEYVDDLSPEFQKKFIKFQVAATDEFRNKVKEIIMDEVFNSKHNRLRMTCEQYLYNHLTTIIKIHNNL